MKLLVTGAWSRLGRHLAESWGSRNNLDLVLTDWEDRTPDLKGNVQSIDFLKPEVLPDLLTGVDLVLHLDPLNYPADRSIESNWQLYRSLCGLYNLSLAAQAAGVDRFILGSSLSLFDRHPEHWQVNEVWRPCPTPQLEDLIPWLSELSLRESVRKGKMLAVCLRFGICVDSAEMSSSVFDPRWVHVNDALQAVDRALHFDAAGMRNSTRPDWCLFHVSAPGPMPRSRWVTKPAEKRGRSVRQSPLITNPNMKLSPRTVIGLGTVQIRGPTGRGTRILAMESRFQAAPFEEWSFLAQVARWVLQQHLLCKTALNCGSVTCGV